ncbi:MAG: PRC-barrel domain-containing protein [Methylocella sp.]
MKKILSFAALTLLASTAAFAQQPGAMSPPASAQPSGAMPPSSPAMLMTTVPGDCVTVTNYYKQKVYDPSDHKIGEIADVLVNKEGRIMAVIISVGGFLGVGEKDVAAPFEAILEAQKGNESYLVMNTTKEALKNAPGYKYDKNTTMWVPDKS